MERPKVGVGVLIIDGGKVLLGKRKNAHGDGSWAPPGGHLEYGETWQECVRREALEETGLVLDDVQFHAVTNDIFAESNKHYVTIFMRAVYTGGIVENREPEKCEAWEWFTIDCLPEKLFLPFAQLVEQKVAF